MEKGGNYYFFIEVVVAARAKSKVDLSDREINLK